MNKMLTLFVLGSLCAAYITACTPAPMPTTVIEISNATQLASIVMDGKYKLTQDISVTNWTPIGNAGNPFTGEFDGNGHMVVITSFSNVENAFEGIAYYGLFGYIKGGKVQRLLVGNTSLHVPTNNTLQFGGIVGCLEGGSIAQCVVSGNMEGRSNGSNRSCLVGGIAGNVFGGGSITDCCTYAIHRLSNVSGSGNVTAIAGGIAGSLFSGTIQRCYARGAARAYVPHPDAPTYTAYSGGIVGFIGAQESGVIRKLTHCVVLDMEISTSSSVVNDHRVVGGITSDTGNLTCANNYAPSSIVVLGTLSPNNGTAITDAQLKDANWWQTSIGWSSSIWDFSVVPTTRYPYMKNIMGMVL